MVNKDSNRKEFDSHTSSKDISAKKREDDSRKSPSKALDEADGHA